jgi:hypothetical protein
MAKNTQLSDALVDAQADLIATLLDDGYLRVYSGTQPANADTAVTDQTLLAEFRFASPSAPDAVNGVLTFSEIAASDVVATGTASWCRMLMSDGSTAVLDGSVGTADANLVLTATSLAAGSSLQIDSLSHTVAKSLAGQ